MIDMEKELAEAKLRAEYLLAEYNKTLGVISFIEYMKKDKENECDQTGSDGVPEDSGKPDEGTPLSVA
jgi:hypothetical protein